FLRRVTLDEGFVKALVEDYEHAPLSDADRAMLDYVGQLTKDATRIGPADHAKLRAVGFDDRGLLQVTLIASWFNYITRLADALGLGGEPEGMEAGTGPGLAARVRGPAGYAAMLLAAAIAFLGVRHLGQHLEAPPPTGPLFGRAAVPLTADTLVHVLLALIV